MSTKTWEDIGIQTPFVNTKNAQRILYCEYALKSAMLFKGEAEVEDAQFQLHKAHEGYTSYTARTIEECKRQIEFNDLFKKNPRLLGKEAYQETLEYGEELERRMKELRAEKKVEKK